MSHNGNWPDLSAQEFLRIPSGWWVKEGNPALRPGLLVKAILPHVDLMPYRLQVEREEARTHKTFTGQLVPLSTRASRGDRTLPVAGLPEFPGESWTVHRAKKRPALVLSAPGHEVDKGLRQGSANWEFATTVLVAPYYGADQDGKRGGWQDRLVERIQVVEYPQYFWDRLPGESLSGSILRLDHVQPIGTHQNSFEPTGYALAPAALLLVHSQLDWLMSGRTEPMESTAIAECRNTLMDLAGY